MYDKKTKVEVFLWTCCTYKLCEHAVHTTSTMSSWRIMQTSWLSALSDCRLPICARSRPASSLFSLSRFVSLRRCVRVSSSVSAICSCSRSPWSFGVSFNRSYAQKHSRRYFFLIDFTYFDLKPLWRDEDDVLALRLPLLRTVFLHFTLLFARRDAWWIVKFSSSQSSVMLSSHLVLGLL